MAPSLFPTDPDCDSKLMDIVIIVDTSSSMTFSQCKRQQEHVSETMVMLKPADNNKIVPNVRVSIIEMGTEDIYLRVDMNQYPYNRDTGADAHREIEELFELMGPFCGCDLEKEAEMIAREGNPNLYDALECALSQFDFINDTERKKYIIIFDNERAFGTQRICDYYRNNEEFDYIDIIMYNQNATMQNYLGCLVRDDGDKILTNPTQNDTVFHTQILPQLKLLICGN